MKAHIESTDKIVAIAAVGFEGKTNARVWEGVTEAGVPFVAYIPLVQVKTSFDTEQFERELSEHKPASWTTQHAIDARMV